MPTITATDLRSNLYRLLDQVSTTGEPLLVKRGDCTVELRLIETTSTSPFARLVPHPGTIATVDAPLNDSWNEPAWAAKWQTRLG